MVQEVIEVLIATALGVSVRVVWRYLQRCPPPKKIIQVGRKITSSSCAAARRRASGSRRLFWNLT
jgi:hypothetical protein